MNKWPETIYKQKAKLGNLNGQIWLDRWQENIWFQTSSKLYVPLEVNRILKTLPFEEYINITFKLIYSEPLPELILPYNPFLALVPNHTGGFFNYPIPIIYGDEFGKN